MKKILLLTTTILCGAVVLMGCPLDELIPFDATGTYQGTWSIGTEDTAELLEGCGITMTLAQDITALPLENVKISGTVQLNLSCVAVVEWLQGLGLPVSESFSIAPITVEGVMLPDGTVELNSPDILEECPEGEVCMRLAFIGKGQDIDADGAMDAYAGTWGGVITVGEASLPVLGAFDVGISN